MTRATRETLALFDAVKQSYSAIVLDAEKLTASEAPGGIPGDPIIEDNVHFSIKGHSLLGRALAQEIADRDWIAPKEEWGFTRERSFEDISKDLGVTPQLMVSSYLACASYFGRKYDSRILMAQKALALSPEDPLALRQLAWSYWLKGDQTRALETYQQLKTIHPDQWREALSSQPEIAKALLRKTK